MTKYKLKEGVIYQEVGDEALLWVMEDRGSVFPDAVADRDIWLAVHAPIR